MQVTTIDFAAAARPTRTPGGGSPLPRPGSPPEA